jgi:hypothetical protein
LKTEFRSPDGDVAKTIQTVLALSPAARRAREQLTGYTAYVHAASFTVLRLVSLPVLPLPATEVHALCDFVRSAIDMAARRRSPSATADSAESALLGNLRNLVDGGRIDLEHEAGRRLLASWRRWQESGVLQERAIEQLAAETPADQAARNAAAAARLAARGLQGCTHAGCTQREVQARQFKMCSRCEVAKYCCREHQVAAWPMHKAACSAARRSQRQAEAGQAATANN